MSSNGSTGTPPLWRLGLVLAVVALATGAWLAHAYINPRVQAAVGVVCFLGLCAVFSRDLRLVNWRVVGTGLLAQFVLAVSIIHVGPVKRVFSWAGDVISKFLEFSNAGSEFVFGALAKHDVAAKAFGQNEGFIFAVRALPTVIFVSAFFSVMYHLRILQGIVWVFARLMLLLFGKYGVSGAEALSGTANVFMGQTEAPLIIKPYIARMTNSELLAVMIGGMATISGGVMAVYIGMNADATAILATSVMAAPCGLYLSKLLLPETEVPETRGTVTMASERPHANVVDAAAGGASDGMMLVINIIAMLIAFIAGIAMLNYLLAQVHPQLSLELIFSKIFAPFAYLMGVPAEDAPRVGELLGKKLVLNEFVAFKDLTDTHFNPTTKEVKGIQPRSYQLTAYALTGFANFASIGIQLGGIGAMAPTRRADLAKLGMLALLGGFMATLINAAIAGLVM